MMSVPLRLLIIEDSDDDCALIVADLRRSGHQIAFQRVETLPGLTAALAQSEWDAVLSDYGLPGFSALQALSVLQVSGLDLPFIIVSGTIDEQSAVSALRAGAHDFVTKTNLARLVPALVRELRAAHDRKLGRQAEAIRRQQEASFHLLFEGNPLPMWVFDLETLAFLEVNQAAISHYGYSREEFLALTIRDIRPLEDQTRLSAELTQLTPPQQRSDPWTHRKKDGTIIQVEIMADATQFAGRPARLVLANDVTERLRAEAERREIEDRFRQVWETTSDALALTDADGIVMAANPAYFNLYGYPAEQVIGHSFELIFTKDYQEEVLAQYKRVFADEAVPGVFESVVLRADGSQRIIESRAAYLTADGRRVAMLSTVRDITERRQAEAAAEHSQRRFRALIENAANALTLISPDGSVLYDSPAAPRMLGYGPEEWIGHTAFELIHPDDAALIQQQLAQLIVTPDTPVSTAFRVRHKDGAWRWLEAVASNLLADPSVQAIVVNYRDITSRRQTDEKIRFQAHLLDTVAQAVMASDLAGMITYWNRFAETLYGWPAAEALGRNVLELALFDETRQHAQGVFLMDSLRDGQSWSGEFVIRRRDGLNFPAQVTTTPIHADNGEIMGVIAVATDISERKQGEAELQRERDLIAHIMETSPVGITRLDREGQVVFANRRAEQLLGLSKDVATQRAYNVTAWRITDFDGEPMPDEALPFVRVRASGQPVYDVRHAIVWPDGQRVLLSVNAAPTFDDSGHFDGMVAALQDVGDLRRAEAAVEQSERRFRALIEKSSDGVALATAEGLVTYVSPATALILGQTPEYWVGGDAGSRVHPDHAAQAANWVAELVRRPGVSLDTELLYQRFDESWCWLKVTGTNLLDDSSVNALVFNYRDITERKRSEDKIQRQFDYLNALREIDRAITASFDLRISLSVVLAQLTAQRGAEAAAVLVLDSASQRLELAAERGFRVTFSQPAKLRIGEGYAGRAALERQMIHFADLQAQRDNPGLLANLAADAFTGYYALPLMVKGQVRGVLEVFQRSSSIETAALGSDAEWLDFLHTVAGQAAIAIDSVAMFAGLQRSNMELAHAYDATIEGWSRALDLRDRETEGHSQRVTEATLRLGRAMGQSEEDLLQVRRGALLHDIGKMGIPDHILLKPGPLTDEEWTIMRKHPAVAYELLSPITFLRGALDIPYCHHEKWDGTGYPRGLKGEQIPLSARLFAVVDVWDALSSDRPYRPAWAPERVVTHLRALTGTHFDPRAVEVFFQVMG